MDLTGASDSDGEPEAKQQRRYSPRRPDRSLPRQQSPRYRHDSPPARRRGAYRDERPDLRERSGHHDRHPPAPLLPYPYQGSNTTPGSPWHTTPTPPLPRASQPMNTATSRTPGTTPRTARPGNNGPQRGHPLAVSLLRHTHVDGVPGLRDVQRGAYTPSSLPREWGLVPMPPPDTAQFIPPPYALHMCVHLPSAVHYYRACSGPATPCRSWGVSTTCKRLALSPDTILSHGHATHLPHPTRAPPCRRPAFFTQPCLRHGHLHHPCQSLGTGGLILAPTPTEMGSTPAPRPPCGRGPQATPAAFR